MVCSFSHALVWATFAVDFCASLQVGEWPDYYGTIPRDSLRLSRSLSTPSPEHKFIFFHLRKVGGSAIRPYVAEGASKLHVKFFVPCQEKVEGNVISRDTNHTISCNNYNWDWTIGRHSNEISVFAGHFYWHDLHHLSGGLQSAHRYSELAPKYSCLVIVRDPLSRFESCYNERFAKAWNNRSIADLMPFELDDVLANFTDGLHGCNNEIARFLSPNGWGDKRVNDGSLSEEQILETKKRLSSCVIGNVVADCNSTKTFIRRSFPWIPFQCDKNHGHHNTQTNLKNVIPEWAKRAILKKNALDVELYKHAMDVFAKQLEE